MPVPNINPDYPEDRPIYTDTQDEPEDDGPEPAPEVK